MKKTSGSKLLLEQLERAAGAFMIFNLHQRVFTNPLLRQVIELTGAGSAAELRDALCGLEGDFDTLYPTLDAMVEGEEDDPLEDEL